jgi:hypothetical protein
LTSCSGERVQIVALAGGDPRLRSSWLTAEAFGPRELIRQAVLAEQAGFDLR